MGLDDELFDRMADAREALIESILYDDEQSGKKLDVLVEAFFEANKRNARIEGDLYKCSEQMLGELCTALAQFHDQSADQIGRIIQSLRDRSDFFDFVLITVEFEDGLLTEEKIIDPNRFMDYF